MDRYERNSTLLRQGQSILWGLALHDGALTVGGTLAVWDADTHVDPSSSSTSRGIWSR